MKNVISPIKSVFLMLLIFSIVIGCSQNTINQSQNNKGADQNINAEENNSQEEIDEIEITVTQYPTTFFSLPYEVGMDKGFFKEERIEIKGIIGGSGGGTTVRNVLAGKLPFGEVAVSATISSFLAGAPIVIVGGGIRTVNDIGFITRIDAPFEKMEDLGGQKWGYTNPGSVTQAVSIMVLDKIGLKNNSEMVATGGVSEGKVMLEQNEVDTTISGEPLYTIEKDKYKQLSRAGKYIPKFQQTVIVTSPQIIQEKPDLVKRYLNAYQKSVEWIKQNPTEAGEIFAKYAEIDPQPSIEAVTEMIGYDHWDVGLDVEAMNTSITAAQYVGTFKEGTEILWDELLNQSFIPEEKRVNAGDFLGNKK